ncbi:hypothetical protein HK405_008880, partial [Cladochytrium tenue]
MPIRVIADTREDATTSSAATAAAAPIAAAPMEHVKVQHDFTVDVDAVLASSTPDSASFWLSVYNPFGRVPSERPIHGTVACERRGGSGSPLLSLRMDPPAAKIEFTDSISALGASPSGQLLIVGTEDGGVAVYDSSSGSVTGASDGSLATPRLRLAGHKGEVTSARFFPSGEVMLTSSADLTARVWGISGINPVTLGGASASSRGSPVAHSRPITDTAILATGRNVVTCALDGTAWLWELAAPESPVRSVAPRRVAEAKCAINAAAVGILPADWPVPEQEAIVAGREYQTANKLVVFAVSDGTLS